MGVIVDEQELTCSIAPDRFFKAFIVDSHNLIPKLMPTVFKSIEYSEGNGGAGSIKVLCFYDDGGEEKTMKHKVEELDEANRVFKFTIFEGPHMGEHFETVSVVNKVEPGPDGGCVFKCTNTYTTKGDNENVILDGIKRAKEGVVGFFQATVTHLHANPNAYN